MTLRVRLEIVPFGDESMAREIGRLDISNVGRLPNPIFSEYQVIDAKGGGMYDETITHRRADGAWELVRKAIDELKVEGP